MREKCEENVQRAQNRLASCNGTSTAYFPYSHTDLPPSLSSQGNSSQGNQGWWHDLKSIFFSATTWNERNEMNKPQQDASMAWDRASTASKEEAIILWEEASKAVKKHRMLLEKALYSDRGHLSPSTTKENQEISRETGRRLLVAESNKALAIFRAACKKAEAARGEEQEVALWDEAIAASRRYEEAVAKALASDQKAVKAAIDADDKAALEKNIKKSQHLLTEAAARTIYLVAIKIDEKAFSNKFDHHMRQ
jgi:hypothetical protein